MIADVSDAFRESVRGADWMDDDTRAAALAKLARVRKELEAVADLCERQKLFEQMVAKSYEIGKAINMAAFLEIDAVIDPVETRTWILRGLKSMPPVSTRTMRPSFLSKIIMSPEPLTARPEIELNDDALAGVS